MNNKDVENDKIKIWTCYNKWLKIWMKGREETSSLEQNEFNWQKADKSNKKVLFHICKKKKKKKTWKEMLIIYDVDLV